MAKQVIMTAAGEARGGIAVLVEASTIALAFGGENMV